MTIPDVIVANEIPVGNAEPHGIIYKIRQEVTNDNILNYVRPTSNYPKGGSYINTVVKWDDKWQSGNNRNAYLLIDFKDRFIFPTHYSMKGYKYVTFAKEWALYGLNSLDEPPVELSMNTSVGSTFCGDPSLCNTAASTCIGCCCNNDWGTFMINSPTRAFKYLKMMSLVSSSPSGWYIAMRGFEVFGILSKDGRTSFTTRNTFYFKLPTINHRLHAHVFL
jgi:hypothetical protein